MIEFDAKVLGKRLKELRLNAGLSQTALGEQVGVDQTVITRYEVGSACPSLKVLVKLAIIFDTTTDYLLGRVDFE